MLGHRPLDPLPDPPPADKWDAVEFRVKWRRHSYLHTDWDTKETLSQLAGFKRVLNYCKRVDEYAAARPSMSREAAEYADLQLAMAEEAAEEHAKVERVVKAVTVAGLRHVLVKWTGLPYAHATWETEADIRSAHGGPEAIADYETRAARLREKTVTVDAARSAFVARGGRAMDAQPAFLQRGTLRDYQLDGLNWLVYSWSKDENCILADEVRERRGEEGWMEACVFC